MELFFEDKNLETAKKRRAKFGDRAKKIEQRISEFQSVASLTDFEHDFPSARCHEYKGKGKRTYTVDLSVNYRLKFRPVEPFICKEDGGIDKSKVIALVLLGVDDPH